MANEKQELGGKDRVGESMQKQGIVRTVWWVSVSAGGGRRMEMQS